MYKVHTNEGEFFTNASVPALRAAMSRYIKNKRRNGVALRDIIFCWGPIKGIPAQSLARLYETDQQA